MRLYRRLCAQYVVLVLLCGCGLSRAERAEIIHAASVQAAEVAYQTTYAKVKEELVRQGKTVEEAEALARAAADVAGKAAGAVAGKAAGSAADALGDEKRSKTSGWFAAALPIILGLAGDLLKKLGGAA